MSHAHRCHDVGIFIYSHIFRLLSEFSEGRNVTTPRPNQVCIVQGDGLTNLALSKIGGFVRGPITLWFILHVHTLLLTAKLGRVSSGYDVDDHHGNGLLAFV